MANPQDHIFPNEALNRAAPRINLSGVRAVARELVLTCVSFAVLFLAAGTVRWANAWLLLGLSLAYHMPLAALLIKVNPEMLNARGKVIRQDTPRFEWGFVVLYLLIGFAAVILGGLDAVRFRWSSMPTWLVIPGVLLYLLAFALGGWAMAVNPYFEPTVRIQHDRGHEVCTAGPYRVVRHPGYAATILGAPGFPLVIGSWWAFLTVGAYVLLFVVRTALEDRFLLRELPGYTDYARRTRYRLIPGIW